MADAIEDILNDVVDRVLAHKPAKGHSYAGRKDVKPAKKSTRRGRARGKAVKAGGPTNRGRR